MNSSPKISIIIPIYNAELYLRDCLESLTNQTIIDWECILVDDGSTDESGAICDEYSQIDNRFRVFHNENSGVSSARNIGIECAQGEWVSFIDADDYVSNNYFEAIIEGKADIILSKSLCFEANTDKREVLFSMPTQEFLNIDDYRGLLSEHIHLGVFRTPWGKIIKRYLIGDTRFVVGQKLGEDTVFFYNIYKKAMSIQVCNESVYYFRASEIQYTVKYRLDVSTALQYLERIYDAYKGVDVNCPDFESVFLPYFLSLVNRKDLRMSPKKWFEAPLVKEMEPLALLHLNSRKKVEYELWKIPILATVYLFTIDFCRLVKSFFRKVLINIYVIL